MMLKTSREPLSHQVANRPKSSKKLISKTFGERVLLTFGYIPHLWHTSVKANKAGEALWSKVDAVTQLKSRCDPYYRKLRGQQWSCTGGQVTIGGH